MKGISFLGLHPRGGYAVCGSGQWWWDTSVCGFYIGEIGGWVAEGVYAIVSEVLCLDADFKDWGDGKLKAERAET